MLIACQLSGEPGALVSVMGGFGRRSNGPLVNGDQNLWMFRRERRPDDGVMSGAP